MQQIWTWVFEPGFFSSAPVHVAVVTGGVAAIVSAVTGVFTVMRGQSFAGHALGDVAAAGGSGALLVGLNPLLGFVGLGIFAAGYERHQYDEWLLTTVANLLDDDLCIFPLRAGVSHVRLDGLERRHPAALRDTGLYQEPGSVADGRDDLLGVEDILDKLERLRFDAQ